MAAVTPIYPAVQRTPGEISNVANNDAAAILTKLITVDGIGSGLDADKVDGKEATELLSRANHTGTQLASTISDFAAAAAIAGKWKLYETRAEAIAATVDAEIDIISVFHAGELLDYVRDASGTALTTNGGTVTWSPSSVYCYFEHWGADGNYVNDASKGTDDTAAIAAAVAWLGVKRGGKITALGRYRTTAPTVLANRALEIDGIKWERAGASVSTSSTGVVIGDFTDGPVFHINQSEISLKLTVLATADRTAATITTGYGNVNCGILVEAADTVSGLISDIDIDCLVRDQPADGIACEGPMVNIHLHDSVTTNNGRHGRSFTSGELSGRTNIGRLGIIHVGHGLSADNGGHNIAIGHPDEGTYLPYRMTVGSIETYRGGWDVAMQHVAAANYVRCENFHALACASDGKNDSNTATHSCWFVSGRDLTLETSRYISAGGDCVIEVGSDATVPTRGVWIKGGKEANSTMTNFLKVNSAASGVYMDTVDHSRSAAIATPVSATNVEIKSYNSRTLYNRNDSKAVTIVSGEITVSGSGIYVIDTEGAAAADDLTNILGHSAGEVYYFAQANAARTVTLRHATGGGNLRVHGATSYAFTSTSATIGFRSNGTQVVPFTAPASV